MGAGGIALALAAAVLPASPQPAEAVPVESPAPAGIYVDNWWPQPGDVLSVWFVGYPDGCTGRSFSFVSSAGVIPLETVGMGWWWTSIVNVQIPETLGASGAISGTLTVTCTPDLGDDEIELSAPMTVSPTPPQSLFHSGGQFTWDFAGPDAVLLNWIGFAPGETVAVTIYNATEYESVGDLAAVSGETVHLVADGAGAITGEIPTPAFADGDQISIIATGLTSHRIGDTQGADTAITNALEFTVSASAAAGASAHVSGSGYAPGEPVVIALHAASSPPVLLKTLTADGYGRISGEVLIPVGVPAGDYRIWGGSKTVSFVLLNAPITVSAAGADLPSPASYTTPSTSVFDDAPTERVFFREISWLADAQVSTGWAVGANKEFRPLQPVLRDQMAAFLYRFAGSPAYTPPAVSPFTDVPTNYVFYTQISWLAEQGISTGYDIGGGKKQFRPFEAVSRDQMAAFLYRFAGSPGITPSSTSAFTDVSTGYVFHKQISWLADTGVTTGWDVAGGKEFRPFQPVLRDQMAAFLYRFAGLR